MQLRPYQQKSIDMVRESIRKGNKKILLVMPTGSGKTHVLSDIASGAVGKGNRVIAAMHRRQLVQQMAETFLANGIDTAMIMAGEEGNLDAMVQVVSLATFYRRLQLKDLAVNPFFINAAVLLIDECHHVLSKTYQKVMSNYKDKIVIGVTATPCLSSGVGMGNYFDDIVQPVSIKSLIDGGYLVPGVYYGPDAPDLSGVKTVAGDYEKKGLGDVMNQPKIIGSVVHNWLKIAGDKRTMVFAVNVDHSRALAHEFRANGVDAEHLDAHHDDDSRNEVLGRFRGGITQVLCNVGLYTEGTDIPEIECISIARPTKSLGLHLQIIGRGARPYHDKQNFIVIDHGGNVERLGFYEDEITWTLDGEKQAAHKKKKYKKKLKAFAFNGCKFGFLAKEKCPNFFMAMNDYGQRIVEKEAELVSIGSTRGKATKEEKQRFFSMLEYHRRSKNYQRGWASWKYKEKFGCWPKGLYEAPVEPDLEFRRWLQYQNIRSAKRREKDQKQLTFGGDK